VSFFSEATVKAVPGVLDVVAVVSNPRRYATRYHHYRNFKEHMLFSGVRLTTVELVHGKRCFEVTSNTNPRDVQLRTEHEIWHKENLINIGISRLPDDWEYVAWIDADVTFNRPNWVYETLHALQHWDIVQLFSHSLNLGPKYEPIFDSHVSRDAVQRSVIVSWLYGHFHQLNKVDVDTGNLYHEGKLVPGDGSLRTHEQVQRSHGHSRYQWHSGLAWAARRSAITAIGGLVDWAILGSADRHMADMMIGNTKWNRKLSPGYQQSLDLAAARFKVLNGNFGYVDGLITHHWHGKLVNRRYLDRWLLLYKHQFDPIADLYRDEQGLWQLTPNKPELRDDIRRYLMARDEDSIDI